MAIAPDRLPKKRFANRLRKAFANALPANVENV